MRKPKNKLTRKQYRALYNMINNDQSKKTNLAHSPSAVNILGRDNGGGYNLFPENLYITAERVNMLHLWTFNCLFPDVRTVPLCNIDSSQIGFAAISELDDFQKWLEKRRILIWAPVNWIARV